METVVLTCIKEKGKLRIRVYNNPNYHPMINCQFPSKIREEGKFYTIDGPLGIDTKKAIFYRATQKNTIKIYDKISDISDISSNVDKIYDSGSSECALCFNNEKNIIYVPCGHFYVCNQCHEHGKLKMCPICRHDITNILKASDILT